VGGTRVSYYARRVVEKKATRPARGAQTQDGILSQGRLLPPA
jgi:hypothetical protein